MNLEESNDFLKEQDSKKRKKNVILGMIVICAILIVILLFAIYFLRVKESNTSKLYVNDNKVEFSKTLFVTQDDITYVSVREMGAIAGYAYESGEYKKFNEDDNYCYLQNDYEVVSFAVDNDKVKKYLLNADELEDGLNDSDSEQSGEVSEDEENEITFFVKSSNDTMELFELSNNVIKINDEMYVPLENASKVFNISLSADGNSTCIYNIYYLYQYGLAVATKMGYTETSSMYENVRAIVDNILIVKDSKGKYGAIALDSKEQILGMKYSNIQYIQNTEEFFVFTDTTVGLLDKTGKKTIIKPTEYDDLAVFDEINKLYLAQKDGEFGILDKNGNEMIPVTFDGIGVADFSEYELEDSESPNLLDNQFIIVKDNEKYGLYDLEGNRLIKSIYDNFGYMQDEEDKKSSIESLLVLPKKSGIYGLVIEQNSFFGIYDLDKKDIIVPCSLSKIYSKVESGDRNYYMEDASGEKYNIKEFFADIIDEEDDDKKDDDEKRNDKKKNKDEEIPDDEDDEEPEENDDGEDEDSDDSDEDEDNDEEYYDEEYNEDDDDEEDYDEE